MDTRRASAVAFGGILGATARWAIAELLGEPGTWPWPVLTANLVGCVVLGLIVGRHGRLAGTPLYLAATVGFCGALTTFSAFALDVATFIDDADWPRGVGYLVSSVVLGLVAFIGGRDLGRRGAEPAP